MDDLEELRQLKARYFRLIDTKAWGELRDVFCDDFEFDMTATGGEELRDNLHLMRDGRVVRGGDAFIDFVTENLGAGVSTVHHGHMPELQVTSPTTATGLWAMEDYVRWPSGLQVHGFGHYHETYERSDRWRIKTTKLTRLRLDVTKPPPAS